MSQNYPIVSWIPQEAPFSADILSMAPDKPNSVVVDMESGNGKEMTNQNYAWSLGDLVQTGSETDTASDVLDVQNSCQNEATKVVKRGESISKYSNFFRFRKAAYNILRVRKLTTQIRPYGKNKLPALLPNPPEAIRSEEEKMDGSKNELDNPNQISNVSTICAEVSLKQRRHDAPKTFSGAEAVESLKKYMEARVSEVSLEAGQPKLRFIPMYMKFLSKLGLGPVPATSTNDKNKCVRAAQMVLFWIIATTACLTAALAIKDTWLTFRVDRDLIGFIAFGFFGVNLMARVKLITCFTKMLNTDGPQKNALISFKISQPNKESNVVSMLISTSVMLTFAVMAFGNMDRESWSVGNMQLVHAYRLSRDLFIWRPRDLHNGTEAYLEERFGTNLTSETICLATFGNVLSYIDSLHAHVIVDLFLVLSLEVYQIQTKLTSDIEMTKLSVPDADAEFRINWNLYIKARDTCEKVNEIFGGVVKMVHVKTMFEISYLLVRILTKKQVTVKFLVDICNAIKIASAYRFLKKCAEKNDKLEDFVTQYSQNRTEIDVEGKQINVALLLRGMKKRRIGLGRGEFYVDEAFVLKMTSAIGAVFTLLMDQLDKKDC